MTSYRDIQHKETKNDEACNELKSEAHNNLVAAQIKVATTTDTLNDAQEKIKALDNRVTMSIESGDEYDAALDQVELAFKERVTALQQQAVCAYKVYDVAMNLHGENADDKKQAMLEFRVLYKNANDGMENYIFEYVPKRKAQLQVMRGFREAMADIEDVKRMYFTKLAIYQGAETKAKEEKAHLECV